MQLCHSSWPGCLRSIAPETFQTYSYLSCTAQSDTCNKTTYNLFEVVGTLTFSSLPLSPSLSPSPPPPLSSSSHTQFFTNNNASTITGSGDDFIKPTVNPTNPADTFLNETSVFQCNISVSAKTYLRGFRAGWKINGVVLERVIPQHLDCDLNPSLEGTDNEV